VARGTKRAVVCCGGFTPDLRIGGMATATEERMTDADVRGPDRGSGPAAGGGPVRGSGGTNMILILLVVVALGLVVWLVLNRGENADIEVNVPEVETPDVEIKSK
jgi:hypothetical protein